MKHLTLKDITDDLVVIKINSHIMKEYQLRPV